MKRSIGYITIAAIIAIIMLTPIGNILWIIAGAVMGIITIIMYIAGAAIGIAAFGVTIYAAYLFCCIIIILIKDTLKRFKSIS